MDHLARTSLRLVALFTLTGITYSILYAIHAPTWLLAISAILWTATMAGATLFAHWRLFPPSPIPHFQDRPRKWPWKLSGGILLIFGIALINFNSLFLGLCIMIVGLCTYYILLLYQPKSTFLKSFLFLLLIWGVISVAIIGLVISVLIAPSIPFYQYDDHTPFYTTLNTILYSSACFVFILQLIPPNDFSPSEVRRAKRIRAMEDLGNCYRMGRKMPQFVQKESQISLSVSPQKQIWELTAYQLGAEEGIRINAPHNRTEHEQLRSVILKFREESSLKMHEPGYHAYCLQCQYPAMDHTIQGYPFPYCPICKENETLRLNVQYPIGHTDLSQAVDQGENKWGIPVWEYGYNRPRLAWVDALILEPNAKFNVDWLAYWWLSQLLEGNPRLKKGMGWVVTEGVNLSGPTLAKVEWAASKGLITLLPAHSVQSFSPKSRIEPDSQPK